MKVRWTFIIVIALLLGYSTFFYVSRSPLITDDFHPEKSCDAITRKSDVLYVMPFFNNKPLTDYPEWCVQILSLNKTLGLHGITHEYHEFLKPIQTKQLTEAIDIFEQCFGYKPTLFKPPYNKISPENEILVHEFNMTVYDTTYILHPYCHCTPGPIMKILNWIIAC